MKDKVSVYYRERDNRLICYNHYGAIMFYERIMSYQKNKRRPETFVDFVKEENTIIEAGFIRIGEL